MVQYGCAFRAADNFNFGHSIIGCTDLLGAYAFRLSCRSASPRAMKPMRWLTA
jgi:hypothetical protein